MPEHEPMPCLEHPAAGKLPKTEPYKTERKEHDMDHEHDTFLNTAPKSTGKPVNENMAEGNEYSLIEKFTTENAEGTAVEKHMEENGYIPYESPTAENAEGTAVEKHTEGNGHILYESPAAENATFIENATADMNTGKENGDPSRESDTPGSVTGEPSPLSGKEKAKDILLRSAKTFAQTALGCLIAGLAGADLFSAGGAFWKGLLLSSLSAGLSAAWNTAIALLK